MPNHSKYILNFEWIKCVQQKLSDGELDKLSNVCMGFCHWLCRCASDVCIKAYTQTHRSRQYMVNRYLFWEVGRWCKTLFFLPPAPFVDEMCAVLDLSLMEEVDPYLTNRLNADENVVFIFTVFVVFVKICFSFFHIFFFILSKLIPFCCCSKFNLSLNWKAA